MAIDESSLGCGRSIDAVWANIGSPPNSHEASCPDCTDARQQLAPLAASTLEMHDADLVDETLRPSSRVKANIMQIARAEVRRGRRLPLRREDPMALDGTVPGSLQISEQAIAGVVRTAADRLPGLQARRCSVELVDDDAPEEGVAAEGIATEGDMVGAAIGSRPATIKVTLRVSVASTVRIPALVDQLRGSIARDISAEVGVHTKSVDVIVEDVHDV